MITKRRTSFTQTEETILRTKPAIDHNNGPPSLAGSSTNSRRTRTPNILCKSPRAWNMNSLRKVLPESPSPICSTASTSPLSSTTCSPESDTFFTHLPTASSSTSRNQNKMLLNAISEFRYTQSVYTASSGVKDSRIEVDEDDYMDHGRFYHPNQQNSYPEGDEEISVFREYRGQASTRSLYEASNEGSRDALRHSLMTRPKPYSTFLDEVKEHEAQAEIEAWRKAKQMETMDRLKRKEAEISNWEVKHTNKAMEEMKRFEGKLEKKHAKALEKLQKRISTTKAEADKKNAKARQETVEKLAAISKVSSTALATKNSLWTKLTRSRISSKYGA